MPLVTEYNVNTTGKRYDDIDPPQAWYVPSVTDTALYHSSRQVARNKTPNFKALRQSRKRVPPLPYESRSTIRKHPEGWVRTQVIGAATAQKVHGTLNENLMDNLLAGGHSFTTWNDLDGQVASEYNQALQKCRLKFKSEAAELGAGLIQLGQTKSLFVDSVVGLGKLASGIRAKNIKSCREAIATLWARQAANAGVDNPGAVKRFKRAQFKKHAKVLRQAERKLVRKGVDGSSAFLAYSFGWKPTLQDLDSAVNQLAKYNVQSDYRVTHRSRVNSVSIEKYPIGHGNSAFGNATSQREVGVQVIISALPTYHSLLLGQGLGLTNPPAFAYEVVPFSFILDYVVNIGGWLNSFDALLGYDGCETVITRRMRIRKTGVNDPPSVRTYNGITSTFSAKYTLLNQWKHVRRDVSYGQPPFVERPSFGGLLNRSSRVATTLAVAVQQLWRLTK